MQNGFNKLKSNKIHICWLHTIFILSISACRSQNTSFIRLNIGNYEAEEIASKYYPIGICVKIKAIRNNGNLVGRTIIFKHDRHIAAELRIEDDVDVKLDESAVRIANNMPIRLLNADDAKHVKALDNIAYSDKSYAWEYAIDAVKTMMLVWQSESGIAIVSQNILNIIPKDLPSEYDYLATSSDIPLSGTADLDWPNKILKWSISDPGLNDIQDMSAGGTKLWAATLYVEASNLESSWLLEWDVQSNIHNHDLIYRIAFSRAWKR